MEGYLHYAKRQLAEALRLDDRKKLYHALRLVGEAHRISKGLEPRIYWPDNEEEYANEPVSRDFILGVRTRQIPFKDGVSMVNSVLSSIEKDKPNWRQLLPAAVSESRLRWLNDLVVAHRVAALNNVDRHHQ